jgi:hypothetical protein
MEDFNLLIENISKISLGIGFTLCVTNSMPIYIYLIDIVKLNIYLSLGILSVYFYFMYNFLQEIALNKLHKVILNNDNTLFIAEINLHLIFYLILNTTLLIFLITQFKNSTKK